MLLLKRVSGQVKGHIFFLNIDSVYRAKITEEITSVVGSQHQCFYKGEVIDKRAEAARKSFLLNVAPITNINCIPPMSVCMALAKANVQRLQWCTSVHFYLPIGVVHVKRSTYMRSRS